ncbi:MAG: hypothetical protein QOE61_1022 [Micromonosporaceae bacterium]|nr:hypothetical protein [Micromonosporaceae bacterium]
MGSFQDRLGEWLTPLFDRYDALLDRAQERLDRAQERLDRTAGGPLRAWLWPVLFALAASVGLVALLRLFLTATSGAGPVWRWVGAAVAGVLALVLLVIVIRNVVISLVEPSQRRLLLLASLTSAAAVLVGVEAFAAVTVALADHVPTLWTVERFYLWRHVKSVPLLEIPGRLGWTEPSVLPGLAGRLLVLSFTLTVIPPLVRVGVALYGFVEGQAHQRRYTRALAGRMRGRTAFTDEPEMSPLLVLGAGAGAAWSGISLYLHGDIRVWSLTSVAFLAAVAAAAATVSFGYAMLTEQVGVITLAASIGLVWFDTTVRQTLLPSVAGPGVWGRIWVTLVVWLVLHLIVITFFWAAPEFADTVLALALTLGFIGADAPAAQWLHPHLTWQPWDIPLSRVVVAACGWFTVAFLLRMLWRAARRPPVLGHSDMFDTAGGLRQDLRGYALVAGQVVIAAGGALTLLRTIDAVDVAASTDDGWNSATQSLTAAAWHVVGSLPGPDIPEILDWRLGTDVTGSWAGLVIVLAVAAVVVFAGLPILRTVVLWARLSAGRPRAGKALTAVPAGAVANLRAVVEFLDAQAQVTTSHPSRTVERRLVDAELDRPRLQDLFGESEWYQLADRALLRTADAYRTWVNWRARVGIEGLDNKVAVARYAVDAFAEAVEGWQASLEATMPAPAPAMVNQHPGACRFCAGWLVAGEGILVARRGLLVPAHGQTRFACPPSDQRKPAPPLANTREGACVRCGQTVPAGEGVLDGRRVGHRGECPAYAPPEGPGRGSGPPGAPVR